MINLAFPGSFKNGLPHGKGKYEWESGEIYEGEFRKGLKHGIGRLTFQWGDRDTVVNGEWLRDRFVEPVFDPPEVLSKVHIKGHFFKRLSEGSTVVLSFPEIDPQNIEDLFIIVNTGIKYESGRDLGYKQVQFPFHCKIVIPMEDPYKLRKWECILEFVIKDPGYWIVQIYI